MHRSTRVRDVATGALAVLALLTLVVGVPLALLRAVGWPLPVAVPDPGAVGNALRYGMITPATLLKVLAVVVWVAWLALTTSIAVEVAALVRGTVARAVPALGGPQQVAARLVTAVMLLSTLSTRPAVAAPPPAAVPVADAAPEPVPDHRADDPSPTWEVQRHDSLWTIAERTLGDGHRWREIHELNVGRRQADGARLTAGDMTIRPGWVLRLPRGAGLKPASPGGRVEVERGDHLWGLAERHLGDGERWRDIYRRNAGREQPDGRALAAPDVILPGWVLELPGTAAGTADRDDRARADADTDHDADADHGAGGERGSGGTADGHDGDGAPDGHGASGTADRDNRTAGGPGAADAGQAGGPAPVAPLPVTPSTLFTVPGGSAAADADRTARAAEPAPALVAATVARSQRDIRPAAGLGLTAAALVGLLMLRRRHWLRHRQAGSALAPVDPEAAELERWLRAIADHELSHRSERMLRLLAEHFALHDVDPVIIAVEFGERISLWLATADPAPPPGIRASEDGRRWTLDPELEVAAPMDSGGPLLTPALVSCGRRPAGEVVTLNLLAVGVLDVTGADEHVREAVTSWTAELATSGSAGVEVIVVGAHHDLVEQFTTVSVAEDPVAALERLDRARDTAAVVISGTPAEGEAWEALRTRALDDPLVAVVSPGHPEAGHRVQISADRVMLMPAGTALERPEWLTPDTWDRFDELLRQPARQQPSDLVPSPLLSAPLDGHLAGTTDDEHAPRSMVRVLGPFELDGHETPEPDARDLLAFLAVHRDGATVETLAANLGWDHERTVAGLAAAHEALGGDDHPLLAVAGDGRHRLASDVACDIDRLHTLTRDLHALPPAGHAQRLTAALDLVRGAPFRDAGGWAHVQGLVTTTTALLSDLAHRLATLMMTFGDLEQASWAIAQGLLANPRSELLQRDRMRVADATGDHVLLDAVMDEVRRRADAEHGRVTPETLQLYERLKRPGGLADASDPRAASDDPVQRHHRHAS
jgi:hypothetical protein